jgi:hybrid polyketide synthase / nonribosomal peptide synthetase ACE1
MFLEDRTASNITFSYNIDGQVRVADLSRAIKVVAQAHEVLRSCFVSKNGSNKTGKIGLIKVSKLQLQHENLNTEADLVSTYKRVRDTVYDLEQGEMMQIVLLSRDLTAHKITFEYHHIILDGVGFETLLADLERAYNGQAPVPQGLQDFDYCQNEILETDNGGLENKISYWNKNLWILLPFYRYYPFQKSQRGRRSANTDRVMFSIVSTPN